MTQCVFCGEDSNSLLSCRVCHRLYPSATENSYHELFGLEFFETIDQKALGKKYRSLSREIHPDLNVKEKELAEELSVYVNEAFSTLSDRGRLLEHVLKSQGGKSATEDKSTDQIFLMQMMEYQEQIESEPTVEEKEMLEKMLDGLQTSCFDKAENLIKAGDKEGCRKALNEASYCRRLMKNLGNEDE